MLLNVLVRPSHLHGLGDRSLHIGDHQLLAAKLQVLCQLFQGFAPRQINVIDGEAINDNKINLLPLPLPDLHRLHSKILHLPRIDEIQPRIHAHHHCRGQQSNRRPVVTNVPKGPVPQHAHHGHIRVSQLVHRLENGEGEAHAEALLDGEPEGDHKSRDHNTALTLAGVVSLAEFFEGDDPDGPLDNNGCQRRQRQVLHHRQQDQDSKKNNHGRHKARDQRRRAEHSVDCRAGEGAGDWVSRHYRR
mmetsp:Transcript_18781/g.41808  ORF Transcript_18781/g.41808 Transcript_18781/m.41808 type:complete len:246 (-) Transcript_18781:209-946(-)